jgi:hypothetical protein
MRGSLAAATAAILAASLAPALASPAETTVKTVMHAAPDFHSAVVQTIPAHAQIDVTGCGQMWCSASWRNIPGFVRANTFAGAPDAPPPPYAGDGPVGVAPPVLVAPYYGWGWHGGWGWGGGWGYGYHHYY